MSCDTLLCMRCIGTIPSELYALTKLYALYLSNNRLSGSIPSQVSSLTNIRYVDLSHNELTGVVGSFICIPSITPGQLRIGSNPLFTCINQCVADIDNNTCGPDTYPCGVSLTPDCMLNTNALDIYSTMHPSIIPTGMYVYELISLLYIYM